ncbi:Unknown protein sequence [Pseudomonas syringae pv. cerasicola]|uniref:Uncharacterized protein n=1 Tax=Pseudomonas syringae pv. cerasicola TaxID=264451 RepID=A0A0P9M985_PSESX|nr:Unknown protein sequence [Pseudomonas syringae pv. cerasicola]
MPGLALTQGLLGSVDGVVTGQQVEVLLCCGVDPGLGIVRRWRQHRQGMHDAFDGVVFPIGQRHQGLKRIIHLALGENPAGTRGVVAGLRLQHVGLVRQADIETLVGLIELAFERCLLGLGRGQIVLGAQHAEIALCRLQDQVLLGSRQLECRLLVARLGGLQLEPAVGTEDRLAQGGLIDVTSTGGHGSWLVDTGAGIVALCAAGNVRQQPGAGLRYGFLAGIVIGAGCRKVGIVVHRLLIDIQQTCLGRQWHIGCPRQAAGRKRNGHNQRKFAQHEAFPVHEESNHGFKRNRVSECRARLF